jgi:hypothetical protein
MKVFNEVDFEEWQEVADKCEYATFFHTPTWSKVFAETYPEMEIATKKFVFDDGTRVILPLIKTKAIRGLFSSYVSNIAGVYGGIISEREIKEEETNEIFTRLTKGNIANVSVTGNPLFDHNLPKQFKTKEDFTQIINLGRDEKEIWADYKHDSKTRPKIKKAERAGVVCKEANNFDEWKEYYSIYQEALKGWGSEATSAYPFSLFENIFKFKMQKPNNIKLWLVIFDGKIAGGNLNFYHNKHCVEWHASFLRDYFKYNIRYFLVHNIILDANAKGYKYYDFNPSGGHEGTLRFKETFGPERLPVKRWEWRNPFVGTITNVKRKIVGGLRL